MNILNKIARLFKNSGKEPERKESATEDTPVDNAPGILETSSIKDIKKSLEEIKAAIDNLRKSTEETVIPKAKANEIELPETDSDMTVAEASEERQSLDGIESSENIISEICNKIVSWEEQCETLVTLSQIDLLKFVIADCKQVLDLVGVPTISDEKSFKFSRHEALGLNGRVPRPGDAISQTVENGYELNGKVLLRAKVTLK